MPCLETSAEPQNKSEGHRLTGRARGHTRNQAQETFSSLLGFLLPEQSGKNFCSHDLPMTRRFHRGQTFRILAAQFGERSQPPFLELWSSSARGAVLVPLRLKIFLSKKLTTASKNALLLHGVTKAGRTC